MVSPGRTRSSGGMNSPLYTSVYTLLSATRTSTSPTTNVVRSSPFALAISGGLEKVSRCASALPQAPGL